MTRYANTTRRPFGFTLVEMLVSLAITTFVILVINQLFNQVVETVARGTQGGELMQKSRTVDEQLAFETELQINDQAQPGQWLSRMVGPGGRNGTVAPGNPPGGFLVIVQHTVQAPLTIDDALEIPPNLSDVRSDQLMFVYDQNSPLDAGRKRMPALAPSSQFSFAGDARNSVNSEYVRMWYGHVLQLREDDSSSTFPPANINQIDLGQQNSSNPNALAQDWVLGRQALLLMKDGIDPATSAPYSPVGVYANNLSSFSGISGPGGVGQIWQGMSDVTNKTLNFITGTPNVVMALPASTVTQYQDAILGGIGFTSFPLLTSAKPLGSGNMRAWDVSPTHTYFMGGVSDFIVEWAGDVVDGVHYVSSPANLDTDGDGKLGDGVLDRDPDGRVKWYTSPLYANPVITPGGSPPNLNAPVTYPAPLPGAVPAGYPPHSPNAGLFSRASAAFVWQHEGSPGFTQWPWMIRVRYRLHDRRGRFEGREITVNTVTRETEPEKGQWYETIIQVNYQNIKP